MNTAIEQAIIAIEKKSRQQIPPAAVSSYLVAVGILKNLLETEKEQIVTAYCCGGIDGLPESGLPSSYGDIYYNTTFNK